MHLRLVSIFLVALLVCRITSCSDRADQNHQNQDQVGEPAVRKEFGTGPVKLTVELSDASITTADALTCTMTLRVGDGYEAEFPDLAFQIDMPGMILTHFDERETKEETQTLRIREYEFEPEYPGEFEIPAFEVYYNQADRIQEEIIETEPIEFQVKETPASAEMLELKPFHGLVTVEQIQAERRRTWPWYVCGIGGAIIFAAFVVYLLRRPRPAAPPRPAHEIAMEALRALAAKDLVAKGQIEPFFVEITWIIRDYVELAFGLRAPEQTTEEFLGNIASAPAVARHRNVLEPFLAAADEVKFARAQPETGTIQRAFDTARDFIVETAGGEGGGA